MSRREVAERIRASGIIAIVRLDSAKEIPEVTRAIRAGGVDTIEVTMTTPGALAALRAIADEFEDDVVLGAGTVLDGETTRAAVQAGARFIVGPTVSHDLIRTCARYGAVSVPGAFTPTEIVTATEYGADFVKVFPARALGPEFIRDLLAPLPELQLVPTGGVTLENAPAFLRAGAAAIAVSSSLVDSEFVAAGDFDALSRRARAFREAVDAARSNA